MTSSINETIVRLMGDKNPNVVLCAIKLAGFYAIREAEDKIIPFLSHKTWQVREVTAWALGQLGSEKAKPYLLKMLGGQTSNLRQQILACAAFSKAPAGSAVTEQTSPLGGKKEEEVWQVKKAAAIALSRIEPDYAENPLMEALQSPNPQVIIAAMSGLATIESTKAGEPIIQFLDHSNLDVKKAAIICLGKLGTKEAADKLIELLDDQKAVIRKEAVIGLNHIKINKAIPYFMEKMKDSNTDVRAVAAVALGNTNSKEQGVFDLLRAALEDRTWQVREAALNALGNLGVVECMDQMSMLLEDEEERVRRAAALAMIQLMRLKEKRRYL